MKSTIGNVGEDFGTKSCLFTTSKHIIGIVVVNALSIEIVGGAKGTK